jgi:FtsZ-interacting cell division protein ZipA
MTTMRELYLVVPLVPLLAAIVVGLWGRKMPRAGVALDHDQSRRDLVRRLRRSSSAT